MKITFSKKSVKAINKWLAKNGFDTECVYAKKGDLEFDPNDNIITIPRDYVSDYDTPFMKCLRDLGLTSDFDTVTLSILHELGHAQTFPIFTDKEWRWCAAQKAVLVGLAEGPTDDYLFNYWGIEDELAANNWAILYTKSFPKKVQKLEDIIEQNVKFG